MFDPTPTLWQPLGLWTRRQIVSGGPGGGGVRRGGTIRPERRARRPSAPTSVGRTQDGPGREPYAVASLTTAVHSRIGITLFFLSSC